MEPISQAETKMDVYTALSRLSYELREATVLYFFQDRTQNEIAKILGISQTLVQRRLERAKEQLRVILEKEEGS